MKRDIRALAGRGKVLPFAQSGDFFYKRGLEKLDKNNLPDAMAYYGRALKCDPENREIRIAMAQVLTEMNMYKEQIQYTGKQYYRHNGFKALENQLEADPRHHINNQHKQSRRDKSN